MSIIQRELHEIQEDNMLTYYMYLMYDRSIPDLRDGLKPGQRRVLWAMYTETKAHHNTPHKKASRCVGNTLIFHPHGDQAVFDTMVRLSQNFIQNIPLIDPHGSNGSIDGSGAAAQRYLELRLSKFADIDLMKGINNNAVDFVPNFDKENVEPLVLPAPTCLALINGSIGIAGGFAQSVPPHSVKDVCTLINDLIDNPNLSNSDVAKKLVPDFPTGGILCSKTAIEKAYTTGRGSVKVRAKANIVTNKNGSSEIRITEIPYLVTIGPKKSATTNNKDGGLINSIADKVKDGTIEGIKDIQDHSGKDIDIRIYIKSGYDPNVILNQLYKYTLMETTFKIILVYKNGDKFSDNMPIKRIVSEWIEFRIKTIYRMIQNMIDKAKKQLDITTGLMVALEDVEETVRIIYKAKDTADAKAKLKAKFKLNETQVEAIVNTSLKALTKLEMGKLDQRKAELSESIAKYTNDKKIESIKQRIKDEQLEIIQKYGRKDRLTEIQEIEEVDTEDIIENEDTIVLLTKNNMIKRVKPYMKTQKRNTKGVSIGNEIITELFSASTKDHLLCFTNTGRVFDIKVYEIIEVNDIKNKGRVIDSYLDLKPNEKIVNILCINNIQMKDSESMFVMATENGLIKRTKLEHFANIRKSGLIATLLKSEDCLKDVKYVDTSKNMQDIIITTNNGITVRYDIKQIPDLKRDTYGVTAIKLEDGDKINSLDIIDDENQELFICTSNGLAKTIKVTDMVQKVDPNTKQKVMINDGFPRLTRSSTIKGRISINLSGDNTVVASTLVKSEADSEIIVITKSKILITNVEEFTPTKRPAHGKKLINLDENDEVIKVILK